MGSENTNSGLRLQEAPGGWGAFSAQQPLGSKRKNTSDLFMLISECEKVEGCITPARNDQEIVHFMLLRNSCC